MIKRPGWLEILGAVALFGLPALYAKWLAISPSPLERPGPSRPDPGGPGHGPV